MDVTDELVEAFLNGNEEFTYFLNKNTMEILLDMPEGYLSEPAIDWDDEETAELLVKIPYMASPEAYDLMVDFAKKQEEETSKRLIDALNRKKPFRSFKDQIKGQDIEQAWYDYENAYAKREMAAWIESL